MRRTEDSNCAVAGSSRSQHPALDHQEQAVEDVAQRRQRLHGRAHLAYLEAPLRAQDEVAYAAILSENLQLFGIRL
jgi:hypothetical protein